MQEGEEEERNGEKREDEATLFQNLFCASRGLSPVGIGQSRGEASLEGLQREESYTGRLTCSVQVSERARRKRFNRQDGGPSFPRERKKRPQGAQCPPGSNGKISAVLEGSKTNEGAGARRREAEKDRGRQGYQGLLQGRPGASTSSAETIQGFAEGCRCHLGTKRRERKLRLDSQWSQPQPMMARETGQTYVTRSECEHFNLPK